MKSPDPIHSRIGNPDLVAGRMSNVDKTCRDKIRSRHASPRAFIFTY